MFKPAFEFEKGLSVRLPGLLCYTQVPSDIDSLQQAVE